MTLRRMITIMDEHSDRFPAIERAETYIRLGDWFMITRKPRLAHDAYRSAWQILADEDNATKLLASYFGQPKRLKYFRPRLPQFGPGRYENYDNKYAEVRYSVNEKGVVRNLKIVDSNSPAVMNGNMRSAVRGAIFRPRYVDGQPVVTDDLFLREEFAGTTLPVGAIPADN
ncbi:MAG: hypothetical protein O6931_07410 [Gammaproteobacteria bacterium]|nr:hypothetical protein [Gammaproteobacteria bacterium]